MTPLRVTGRLIVVLNAPKSVPVLISFVQGIVALMTGNAYFTTPVPTLASILANVELLVAAENRVASRVLGAVAARDSILQTVLDDLHALVMYIQGIADKDPTNAREIITSAGLTVKQTGSSFKPPLAAKYLESGSIQLVAKSPGHGIASEWLMSSDQKTWTALQPTMKSSTDVNGLTPGATYHFRTKGVLRKGLDDWSQIVTIIAL